MLSTNNNDYDHLGRERQVIELYNQGKSTRDIAKELRMSLRDISIILKKQRVNHGIAMIDDVDDDNKKSHSSNEKATQAYKLFSEGKRPVQVAIELGLREGQVNKFFREFWKLKNLNGLYEIYPQIEPSLPSFLKLHKALKKKGLNPQNTESFVNLIELGVVKLPELQVQYQKLQDKVQGLRYNLQDMQYRKQGLERYLQAIQQRIIEQTDVLNTLQQTFDTSAEKVSNLYKEKYWLEQSIASHKNSNKE
jgi:Fe-S-cluster formation regulator IscX/YfhJ